MQTTYTFIQYTPPTTATSHNNNKRWQIWLW